MALDESRNSTSKFEHFLEFFRLITPVMVFVTAFMVNNIWNELREVSKEQAKRTVLVYGRPEQEKEVMTRLEGLESRLQDIQKQNEDLKARLRRVELKIR